MELAPGEPTTLTGANCDDITAQLQGPATTNPEGPAGSVKRPASWTPPEEVCSGGDLVCKECAELTADGAGTKFANKCPYCFHLKLASVMVKGTSMSFGGEHMMKSNRAGS